MKSVRLNVVGIVRKMINAPRQPIAGSTTITASRIASRRLLISSFALCWAVSP